MVVFGCSTIKWNYCILDEGHIIKNSKTKVGVGIMQDLHGLLSLFILCTKVISRCLKVVGAANVSVDFFPLNML